MDYRIITDTSCDFSDQMARDLNILYVPFYITIDEVEYTDNDDLDLDAFLKAMIQSQAPIRTACASSMEYMKALEACDEDNIFIVTISSKLSGSYNSAKLAVDEFKSKYPEKNVYLVDSQTAAAGQTSVVLKIMDILEKTDDFESASKEIEAMVEQNKTYFILESLDNLAKNGRINKHVIKFATMINIKPIMKASKGEIDIHEVNRGLKKALSNMVKQIGKDLTDFQDKRLIVSHVDADDKADFLIEKVQGLYDFKEIIKIRTKGLATAYADNGGIIIGF